MNVPVQTNLVSCKSCNQATYELELAPLQECPSCGSAYSDCDHKASGEPMIALSIDQMKGIPILIQL